MMKLLQILPAVCALMVAACGEQEPAAPPAPLPADPTAQVRVVMPISRMSPDWIEIARQRSCIEPGALTNPGGERCPYGRVYYNRHMITRSVDGTVANIWTQIDHGAPQLAYGEDETTTTTIRYTRSRAHYRFRCDEGAFAIIEEQILGENETVVQRSQPREIYRQPVRWSAVAILMPIACEGGTLQP